MPGNKCRVKVAPFFAGISVSREQLLSSSCTFVFAGISVSREQVLSYSCIFFSSFCWDFSFQSKCWVKVAFFFVVGISVSRGQVMS